MKRAVVVILVSLGGLSGGGELAAAGREPIVGQPCEGCEAVFEGLPAVLGSHARIAALSEPGEALRIEGTVFDAAGQPAPGVIVYAYHTDNRGLYPPAEGLRGAAAHHGRLRGWVETDAKGRYRFDTIRPAGYPETRIPAHVHLHVIEPGRCTYYIDDIHFDDDGRLSADQRRRFGSSGRGGPGLVKPVKEPQGAWAVTRDIRLGEGVPGYPPG